MDADPAAVRPPKERQPLGTRLKSLITSILGWLLAFIGVSVLILSVGEDSGWGGSTVLRAVSLIPGAVLVAVAYVVVRSYNKRHEDVSQPSLVLSTTRLAQSWLARELEKIDAQHDHRFDPGNVVLSDRMRITAAAVAEYDGLEKIEFLWFARPAQPDDFLASAQFAGLPASVQDIIVLLDLRRELLLRGLDAFMSTSSGFYCHDMERITQAAQRTGNTDLSELLGSVRTVTSGQSVNDMTTTVLDELDKQETWEGLGSYCTPPTVIPSPAE
ncbi:MAG: hypothetical protein LBL86_11350, partial [Coriobacteriales bacterium]|nr:hypothetical protein [Coriobacteriales bacterium]